MKRLISPITLAVLLLNVTLAFAQPSHSPVGTWEVTLGGGNRGNMFITFSNDFTVTGYGMTLQSFGPFTIQGTWTIDAKGNIVGLYTEYVNGQSFDGTFKGRALAGKRLTGRTVAANGTSALTAIPALITPDISGNWIAYVTERQTTVPEFITVTPLPNFPGTFTFTGDGAGPSGAFTVSGLALVTSKAKVVVYGESDFSDGTRAFTSATGNFNLRRQTGSLTGITDQGIHLRTRITR
jgi:hypothetical protein